MSKGFLKTAFLSSLLTLSALSGAALANTEPAAERDAEGFLVEQSCGFHSSVKKSLAVFMGETPTGIKSSNAKWDMEIYADKKDGSWTLVGTSKDPNGNTSQLCRLARGVSDTPYTQEKWYQAYFTKPADISVPQTAKADVPSKPMPN